MQQGQKLIVLELNEVPFRVFDYYTGKHPDSHLARLFKKSNVFETNTEDEGHLSPWITWPSVHRGVSNVSHGIADFGQDLTEVDGEYPAIWRMLAGKGVSVGVFGPLHSYPLPKEPNDYSFYIPDTFAAGPECFPKKLTPFQEFNLAMVDASGRNVSKSLMLDKALPFLSAAPGLGLRGRTMFSLGRQLVTEKLNPNLICRRRTSQVEIAFDFYLRQLKEKTPDYSIFFSNHVASTLHRYWPGTFPQDYPDRLWADGYEERFSGEIEYVMGVANNFVGELMRFVESHASYSLIVMGSMGQEAVTDRAQVSSQIMCLDLPKFMSRMGVPDGAWKKMRAMSPQCVVEIAPEARGDFLKRLSNVRIANSPLHFIERESTIVLEFGHPNLPDDIGLSDADGMCELSDLGLRNVEINDKSAAFAYHIPQGVFVHYNPRQRSGLSSDRQRISTLEIAPAILRNFGMEPASYMRSGFSLS